MYGTFLLDRADVDRIVIALDEAAHIARVRQVQDVKEITRYVTLVADLKRRIEEQSREQFK